MATKLTYGVLPRPKSIAVITAKLENPLVTKVRDLIDYASSTWREDLIRDTFISYDAELILSLPLCDQWPHDKLIWHYTATAVFSVKSAYHLIVREWDSGGGESSSQDTQL